MKKREKFKNYLAEKYHDYPRAIQKGKYWIILAFITIPILHFFVFNLGTNITSIMLAFSKTKYVSGVGEVVTYTLDNFKQVFYMLTTVDDKFNIALRNTLQLFTVDTLMWIPQFLIAYCFSKNMRGAKFFRVAIYLPSIISIVVFTTIVVSILQPNIGLLAEVVREWFGTELPPLLYSDKYAWPTLLCYCVWAGFYGGVLLLEAAMRRIPREVIEAAKIDGANNWGLVWHITIPMIWGTLSTMIILQSTALLTIDAPILLLTNGKYNTQTLNFWFYEQVAVMGQSHGTAAAGMVMTVLALPPVIIVRKLVNKISKDLEY